jgi:hypothetical protein
MERANRRSTVLHDEEAIPTQTARLVRLVRAARSGSPESVGGAVGRGAVTVEVSARDMEHRLDVELARILPDLGEGDVLGMAEKPGRLVVERRGSVLEWADPEGHRQASALGAQPAARRYWQAGCGLGLNGESHALPGREKPTAHLKLTGSAPPGTGLAIALPFAPLVLILVKGFTKSATSCSEAEQ